MKGYVVLFAVSALILWMIPLWFAAPMSDGQAVTTDAPSVSTPSDEVFTVAHSGDPTAVSTIGAYELTLYETMGAIAPDAPSEAIKAQAVACYTAFCYQRAANKDTPVQTTSLPFPEGYSEAYWNERWGEQAAANTAIFRAALDAVYGQTITYDGQPIMAVYHAMNAGKTEAASVLWGEDLPYLRSVASPADALRVDLHTTVTLTTDEAATVLRTLCGKEELGEAATWFGEASRTEAGTVESITVCGTTFTGRQLRDAFSLPSAAFDVQVQDGQVLFTVSGSGHFVGMSVCGAVAMATDGAAYDTILKHYYTGVAIT